jgi:hypothetical protein
MTNEFQYTFSVSERVLGLIFQDESDNTADFLSCWIEGDNVYLSNLERNGIRSRTVIPPAKVLSMSIASYPVFFVYDVQQKTINIDSPAQMRVIEL